MSHRAPNAPKSRSVLIAWIVVEVGIASWIGYEIATATKHRWRAPSKTPLPLPPRGSP